MRPRRRGSICSNCSARKGFTPSTAPVARLNASEKAEGVSEVLLLNSASLTPLIISSIIIPNSCAYACASCSAKSGDRNSGAISSPDLTA